MFSQMSENISLGFRRGLQRAYVWFDFHLALGSQGFYKSPEGLAFTLCSILRNFNKVERRGKDGSLLENLFVEIEVLSAGREMVSSHVNIDTRLVFHVCFFFGEVAPGNQPPLT